MTLKPFLTWQPRHLRRVATIVAIAFTTLSITLLIDAYGYDSSPPVFTASCAIAGLAWVGRISMWRAVMEQEADEKLIEAMRHRVYQPHSSNDREFEEITQYLRELGESDGFNT